MRFGCCRFGISRFYALLSIFLAICGGRGASWEETGVIESVEVGDYKTALVMVDSIVTSKKEGLPRLVYFDRYLPEDERMDAANARTDIYDLQWLRIMILKRSGNRASLIEALEDYAPVIGYNQDKAKAMLHALKEDVK